jgi:hypothetical protein
MLVMAGHSKVTLGGQVSAGGLVSRTVNLLNAAGAIAAAAVSGCPGARNNFYLLRSRWLTTSLYRMVTELQAS